MISPLIEKLLGEDRDVLISANGIQTLAAVK
jgi:hypothetical protein